MGKHLNQNELKELFDLFESDYEKFNHVYMSQFKTAKSKSNAFYRFRIKYTEYKYNNGMNGIVTKEQIKTDCYIFANKKPKGSKNKNTPSKKELWKELIDSLPEETVAEIVERWYEIEPNENGKKEEIKKIIKGSSLSCRKLALIFDLSPTTVSSIRNDYALHGIKQNKFLYKRIIKIFYAHQERIGRKPMAALLLKIYDIHISYRQVGRIMNKLGLYCKVRARRKVKEKKITNTGIKDLVKRDYNNEFHGKDIIATDVTYLTSPADVYTNHVYFSAAINHRTKLIEGFKLSTNNDNQLVMDTFINLQGRKDLIVHSDHGYQYSSNIFTYMVKMNDWEQSMSRVGNSLDNRVIEYFFCIMKNELIYNLDFKKITFRELEMEIEKYINYYNNMRIQEKLGWLSPEEYKIRLSSSGCPLFMS